MEAMYVIPVTPFTLDLIEALSHGPRPQMETEITFFVFRPTGNSEIITRQTWMDWRDEGKPITIHQYPR